MEKYGFVRVAAATPRVKVADTAFNKKEMEALIEKAEHEKVSLLVFPELSVTGYTCGDLFGSNLLIESAEKAVLALRDSTRGLEVTVVAGAPVRYNDRLYNCAIVIRNGQVKGIVPKIYMPTYNEFYEARWFSSGSDFLSGNVHNEGRFFHDGSDSFREGFSAEVEYALSGRRVQRSSHIQVRTFGNFDVLPLRRRSPDNRQSVGEQRGPYEACLPEIPRL